MTARWEDVNARARGLATHLIAPAALGAMADAPDLPTLARALELAGIRIATEAVRDPAALELAVRRWAAAQIRLLIRWLGDRDAALRVLLEDEDRRSLRAVLRGAVAGAAAAPRLAGLIPTPGLSERMLETLAALAQPRKIAATLAAWRHPYGAPLLAAAAEGEPDPLALEMALDRCWADRAVAGARSGGRGLRRFVSDILDETNLISALLLSGNGLDIPPESAFLAGGELIAPDRFARAIRSADALAAGTELASALEPERAALVRRYAGDPARLARQLARVRLRVLHHAARHDPLGPAPVLEYLLRLRAEVVMLRALIWGCALAMPPARRRIALEEAA